MLPIKVLMFFSIPDCRRPGIWSRLYPLTFFMSIVWIAGASYLMVWMITIAGKSLTFCILMDFPYTSIQNVWACPLCTLKGNRLKFQNYDVFLFLKVVFNLSRQ